MEMGGGGFVFSLSNWGGGGGMMVKGGGRPAKENNY